MKGAWKTIESIFAGFTMMLFVAALGSNYLYATSNAPAYGQSALAALYERGDLREYAAEMNYSAINEEVRATGYLVGFNHTVQICDAQGSCTGAVPSTDNVWTYSIILAGDEIYGPLEVILYVSR